MRHHQQHRTSDAKDEFHCEVKTFAFPCDEQDETHPCPNQRKQRLAAMHHVAGNEAGKSEHNDADGEPPMEGRVSRKVGNDVGKKADDDRSKQAVDMQTADAVAPAISAWR